MCVRIHFSLNALRVYCGTWVVQKKKNSASNGWMVELEKSDKTFEEKKMLQNFKTNAIFWLF